MPNRALVVDANILVRAVLGKRVREVMEAHAENVSFFIPEAAYCEAEEHLAALAVKRGGDPDKALALLRSLGRLLERVGDEVYGDFEAEARERLEMRSRPLSLSCVQCVSVCPGLWAKMACLAFLQTLRINKLRVFFGGLLFESLPPPVIHL